MDKLGGSSEQVLLDSNVFNATILGVYLRISTGCKDD
jgi:hypothetical protein